MKPMRILLSDVPSDCTVELVVTPPDPETINQRDPIVTSVTRRASGAVTEKQGKCTTWYHSNEETRAVLVPKALAAEVTPARLKTESELKVPLPKAKAPRVEQPPQWKPEPKRASRRKKAS